MSGPVQSCLYFGQVMHRRLRPRAHHLAYRVFALYVDLDRLAELDRSLRWFSRNRFNLVSFHDADHGDGGGDLRRWVDRAVAEAGVDLAGGTVGLLSYPRLFGYAFNPLSVYFCFDRWGALAAMLYEVNNTFGERHCYVTRVPPGAVAPYEHRCAKSLYVSPFITMDATYHFRVQAPDERLSVMIDETDDEGLLLKAATTARRVALTDANLWRAVLRYPLMTLKVILGIHWEALKLWRKGVALRRRPAPPAMPVTVMHENVETVAR